MSNTQVAVGTELQISTTKYVPSSQHIDVGMTADLISMDSFPPESTTCSSPVKDMNNPWRSPNKMDVHLPGFQAHQTQSHQPHYLRSPNQASTWRSLYSSHRNNHGWQATGGEVPLSTIKPGPVYPTEAQLQVARTYGIRRDNGTYVPLIPADEISLLDQSRIPIGCGPENMIILPPLQLPRADDRVSLVDDQMVPAALVNSLPLYGANGLNADTTGQPRGDKTQMQIDSIIAASNNLVQPLPRRQKVYCDKWIHDGTCAFTQLGCKYKHEMPLDRATQLSLGLNHGIPKWYKLKHQVAFQRRDSLSLDSTSTSSSLTATPHSQASWRPGEPATPNRLINNNSSLKPVRPPYGPSSFGPIAPPIMGSYHTPTAPVPCNNPFDALSSIEYESEEKGDVNCNGHH